MPAPLFSCCHADTSGCYERADAAIRLLLLLSVAIVDAITGYADTDAAMRVTPYARAICY